MGHLHDTKSVYLDLQQRVERTQSGLPPEPEVYEILRHLFTEQEAAIASRLPVVPRKLETFANRFDLPIEALRDALDRMADKGLVFDFPHPEHGTFYMLAPPVIGFFEFSMMRVRSDIDQKALAGLLSTYIFDRPSFAREAFSGATPIGRTLVHETTLDRALSTDILDFDSASETIRRAGRGAISMCYCRHKREHLGEACARPVDVCLSLGSASQFVVRHGHGREASVSEMLDVLTLSRDEGLVQIVDNVQNDPVYICNCCGCCCAQLSAIRRHGLDRAVSTSSFIATIESETCNGCGKCARACPIQAIALRPRAYHLASPGKPKMQAEIDESICLGCGVCHSHCKPRSLRMEKRAKRVLTPENTTARVISMALGRGRLADLLFDELDGPAAGFARRLVGAIEHLPSARRAMLNETLKSRLVSFLCKLAEKDPRAPSDVYR